MRQQSPRSGAPTRLTALAAAAAVYLLLHICCYCYCCHAFVPAPSLPLRRLSTSAAKMVVCIPGPTYHGCATSRRGRLVLMKVKFDARQDYYARLQVEKTATLTEIKRSYRKLALKTHPDVNKEPNAAETFKKVCEAYKVLSDADARKQYDLARGTSSGFGGSSRWGGSANAAGGASSSSRTDWYEQYVSRPGVNEETRESIDDSFSSIFRDFVGSVATKGGKGVLEDVVEFLESSVGGFGEESNADIEEILAGDDLQLVQEEIENLNFLIPKLREKLQQAKIDIMVAEGKLRTLQAAAVRDMGAVDKRLEYVEQVAALKARMMELDGHMKRADKRQRRLMLRAEELRWGSSGRSAYEKYASPGAKGSASSRSNTAGASNKTGSGPPPPPPPPRPSTGGGSVEEELQKLKKQMGL